MSSPKWTAEQQAAINLRGQILVAAAAGSGKTAVLVERLIRRITNPDEKVDVDRFLVVTFTKAAANEMRERVGKALDDALFKETDPMEVERLLHQRALLYRASITTLHSFCMELIRQYFYQVDLDPAFRVADAAEADLLRQDTVEDLFETYYERENSTFQALVDAFGTDRDDQPLMEQVLRLYEFAISQAQPMDWLEKLSRAYEWDTVEDLVRSPWGEAALQGILDKVEEGIALLERAFQIATQPGGPIQYAVILQDDVARLKRLSETCGGNQRDQKETWRGTWKEIEASFNEAVTFPSLRTSSKKAKNPNDSSADTLPLSEELQKSLREESKKARDEAKKRLDKLKMSLFAFSLEEQLPLLKNMGELLQTLTAVVQEFIHEYSASKRLRNIVDFSDLEHFALRLLQDEEGKSTAIAQNLQGHYAEVLVDEYQDINPVQERILQLVSRQEGDSPNLFMVGDIKQSIYRFRMADPSLFLKKYEVLDPPNPKGSDILTLSKKHVIDLNRNFRSRVEVIEGVNFLFRQIMTKGAGEISYDDKAALCHGSNIPTNSELKTAEGPIEVHLFDPKSIRRNSRPILTSETHSISETLTSQSSTEPFAHNQTSNRTDPSELDDLSFDPADLEGEEESSSGCNNEPSLEELETARIEARLVSSRIQNMVKGKEFQVYDKHLGDFRSVQYSDIVILMRSFSSVAPVYVEEFQSAGIPVYAETSSGYFGASEVETILSLLKVIDNPRLDIPLAAVLRSPLVGMNGTELGKLRSLLPNGDFYEALVLAFWAAQEIQSTKPLLTVSPWMCEMQETLNVYEESLPQLLTSARDILCEASELQFKVKSFWPRLQRWRQLSRRTSLADLLWKLYEETGYLAYVGTLPSGVQRQANLRVLYDRACRYEATNYRGLFRFLRFLEKFQGQGKDLGNARALGENEDVVRLITVHSSKGLEFPVVFMVGLGTKFNTRSLIGRLLLHSELGAGIPLMDIENQVRYPSFVQYAVKERLWQESLAEELRILYVALTRAKERLLLYGNVGKLEDTLLKWQRQSTTCSKEAFSDGQLRSAKNYLDWIGPALSRHPNNLFGDETPTLDLPLKDCSSKWNVIIHQAVCTDILTEPTAPSLSNINLAQLPLEADSGSHRQFLKSSEDWFVEVDSRLSWKYPNPEAVTQSAKTSVSELKRRFTWHTEESEQIQPSLHNELSQSSQTHSIQDVIRPKFIQTKKELTPAERGIALHTVMQHLPLDTWQPLWFQLCSVKRDQYISELLESLIQREILTEEQMRILSKPDILAFLDSPVGTRLLKEEEVRREVPFTLSIKMTNQVEPVLVQGVIDAIILSLKEGKAEVIDFKTDNLRFDNTPEKTLTERYALQLAIYSYAVERLLKISVQQCTIYSTSLKQEFVIPQDLIYTRLKQLS
jgi:ATP-dependent helicase/nuclease subunit A